MIENDWIYIEVDSSNRFESIRFQLRMKPLSLSFFSTLLPMEPPFPVSLPCRSRSQETLCVSSPFLACPCLYEVLSMILSHFLVLLATRKLSLFSAPGRETRQVSCLVCADRVAPL
jgi:hypothetical protein